MSREIKFRAMTKANNVMVFGDLIVCPNGEHRILWFEMKGELPLDVDYKSFNEPVQSSTIGQFTGLKDKNGKDIYENDIVSAWSEGYNHIGQVRWRFEGQPAIIIYPAYANQGFWKLHGNRDGDAFVDGKIDDGVEVLGNIFQNPDLLPT